MPPEAGSTMRNAETKNPLVIGCGALAPELVELTRRAGLPAMDLTCLPASLHNRPERIPAAVADRIRRARKDGYDRIFVAYADCGTGGLLDPVLEAEGVARLEGAHCYEVYDQGINTDADKFIAALEEHKPDILGMSALLTTTMPYMKVVVAELVKRGIRDDYIVLVGGAPLNEEFGKAVGADAYCRDAAVAAETAQALVLARRAAVAAS